MRELFPSVSRGDERRKVFFEDAEKTKINAGKIGDVGRAEPGRVLGGPGY